MSCSLEINTGYFSFQNKVFNISMENRQTSPLFSGRNMFHGKTFTYHLSRNADGLAPNQNNQDEVFLKSIKEQQHLITPE